MTKTEALQLARAINQDAKRYREAISAAIVEPDTKEGAYTVTVTIPKNLRIPVRIDGDAARRYYMARNTLPSIGARRFRVYTLCKEVA